MKSDLKTRHGGKILADALAAQGVKRAFGVPGESFLPVLDGLHDLKDRVQFVICRQEGGASYMAEAYGKLTGEPGVLFVTRGPGATNGSIGVHTGFQDSTPMVMFIGQVGNDFTEREAFQEIDYRRMYGQLAKWVAQIDRVERIPEYVSHAFHAATSGRPGPVVLALPEDMLFSQAAVADVPRHHVVRPSPAPSDMSRLEKLLGAAKKPFVILGGGGWTRDACERLRRWAEVAGLPVGTSFRCQDLFDNRSANYVGDVGIGVNPKLAQRIKDADVVLVIGARLGEMTTSAYTLFDVPVPRQKLVHVHAGADELGRVYRAELPINSGYPQFVEALEGISLKNSSWAEETKVLRQSFVEWTEPRQMPGALQYGQVIRWLSDKLPEDAIVTGGAGNFASWLHRHFRYKVFRTQLGSTAGSMGYGRGEDRRSRAHRAGPVRRRRLPHERAGDRHRRAIQRAVCRVGGEQRHVRHDPHAPGARISGARFRHGAQESGLCRLCAGLRRPRRDGDRDRGVRAGLRAGGRFGQAGADRAQDRSRCDFPGHYAFRHPGKSPEGLGRRRLGDRDEVRVVLVGALELQELVVPAARAVGV
jgi:acetolactate synthase-1/2/3 large subunit